MVRNHEKYDLAQVVNFGSRLRLPCCPQSGTFLCEWWTQIAPSIDTDQTLSLQSEAQTNLQNC